MTFQLRPIVSISPIMRLVLILLFLLPTALFGAGTTQVSVRVVVNVPLVSEVEGPAQVVLAPGEVARIRVQVAANVPWDLSIQSPNASAQVPAPQSGSPGGKAANTRDMDIRCSPEASGPQTIALIYTLMPR